MAQIAARSGPSRIPGHTTRTSPGQPTRRRAPPSGPVLVGQARSPAELRSGKVDGKENGRDLDRIHTHTPETRRPVNGPPELNYASSMRGNSGLPKLA